MTDKESNTSNNVQSGAKAAEKTAKTGAKAVKKTVKNVKSLAATPGGIFILIVAAVITTCVIAVGVIPGLYGNEYTHVYEGKSKGVTLYPIPKDEKEIQKDLYQKDDTKKAAQEYADIVHESVESCSDESVYKIKQVCRKYGWDKDETLAKARMPEGVGDSATGDDSSGVDSETAKSVVAMLGGSNASGAQIVKYASTFLNKGIKYRLGESNLKRNGASDCSGFTMHVYAHFGVNLPKYSQDQAAWGRRVSSLSKARAGDLLVYTSPRHVAIYIGKKHGKNYQIHCTTNYRGDGTKPGIVAAPMRSTPAKIRRLTAEKSFSASDTGAASEGSEGAGTNNGSTGTGKVKGSWDISKAKGGNRSVYTYTVAKTISWTPGSAQYKLYHSKKCWYDKNGFCRIRCGDENDATKDYYVVALASRFGSKIGDKYRFTVQYPKGGKKRTFIALLGDQKADQHTDSTHSYTRDSGCWCEFETGRGDKMGNCAYFPGGPVYNKGDSSNNPKLIKIEKLTGEFTNSSSSEITMDDLRILSAYSVSIDNLQVREVTRLIPKQVIGAAMMPAQIITYYIDDRGKPVDIAKSILTGKLNFKKDLRKKLRKYIRKCHKGIDTSSSDSGSSKMKLRWPLAKQWSTITSDFGNRAAPTAGASTYHQGIDISAPMNAPIYAAADGEVVQNYDISKDTGEGGGGNHIAIKHSKTYTTVYKHMVRPSKLKVGEKVEQGDIVGYVGMTGYTTGPHLHFEVKKNGKLVDPQEYLDKKNLLTYNKDYKLAFYKIIWEKDSKGAPKTYTKEKVWYDSKGIQHKKTVKYGICTVRMKDIDEISKPLFGVKPAGYYVNSGDTETNSDVIDDMANATAQFLYDGNISDSADAASTKTSSKMKDRYAWPSPGNLDSSDEENILTIKGKKGSSVASIGKGTVVSCEKDQSGTYTITIKHKGSVRSTYSQVAAKKVEKGDNVTKGQQIGEISGSKSFNVKVTVNKKQVNPLTIIKKPES